MSAGQHALLREWPCKGREGLLRLKGLRLVTRLWDKRGIEWREQASKPDPTDKVKDTKIIEELKRISATQPNRAIRAHGFRSKKRNSCRSPERRAKEGEVGPLWPRSQMTNRARRELYRQHR
jgi:hypothetical protein